jgi:hypothetical protein
MQQTIIHRYERGEITLAPAPEATASPGRADGQAAPQQSTPDFVGRYQHLAHALPTSSLSGSKGGNRTRNTKPFATMA